MATAKNTEAQTITKKDFILQQSKDLTAKEVAEKAKAQGIELTEKHVHNVRSAAKMKPKAKGAKAESKGPKAQTKAKRFTKTKTKTKTRAKAAAPKKAQGVSKSEFIRSLPAALPAKEVVEKAAAKGIEFSEKYVYVIRSTSKTRESKGTKPAASRKTTTAGRGAVSSGEGADGKLESLVRQAIADCGLVRSREIFNEVEAAFVGTP